MSGILAIGLGPEAERRFDDLVGERALHAVRDGQPVSQFEWGQESMILHRGVLGQAFDAAVALPVVLELEERLHQPVQEEIHAQEGLVPVAGHRPVERSLPVGIVERRPPPLILVSVPVADPHVEETRAGIGPGVHAVIVVPRHAAVHVRGAHHVRRAAEGGGVGHVVVGPLFVEHERVAHELPVDAQPRIGGDPHQPGIGVKHPEGFGAPKEHRPDDANGLYHRPHGLEKAEGWLESLPDKNNHRVHHFPDSGGSMTALPIIETMEGEVSAYIPTNVISITDGQIYLEPDLFFAGVRPAVNVGISVSRVGGNAQKKAMKKFAGSLRLDLASFRELEAFAQLGTDLDAATQRQLDRGARMVELLKQPQYAPFNLSEQVISIFAGTQGHLDDLPINRVLDFEAKLLKHIGDEFPEVYEEITTKGTLSGETSEKLAKLITDFKAQFVK